MIARAVDDQAVIPGIAVCTLTPVQRAGCTKCALTSTEKPVLNSGSTLRSAQNSEASPASCMQTDLCFTITQMTRHSIPPERPSFEASELHFHWEAARRILLDGLMYMENFTSVNSRGALNIIRSAALKASKDLEHLEKWEAIKQDQKYLAHMNRFLIEKSIPLHYIYKIV